MLSGMVEFGKYLKELRNKQSLSLRKVSKQVDISFNTLSAYERGVNMPTVENVAKIARFFDVPMEYFISGEHTGLQFADGELLDLFHGVDELSREDRSVVKAYIRKYLAAKRTLQELIDEAKKEQ